MHGDQVSGETMNEIIISHIYFPHSGNTKLVAQLGDLCIDHCLCVDLVGGGIFTRFTVYHQLIYMLQLLYKVSLNS